MYEDNSIKLPNEKIIGVRLLIDTEEFSYQLDFEHVDKAMMIPLLRDFEYDDGGPDNIRLPHITGWSINLTGEGDSPVCLLELVDKTDSGMIVPD